MDRGTKDHNQESSRHFNTGSRARMANDETDNTEIRRKLEAFFPGSAQTVPTAKMHTKDNERVFSSPRRSAGRKLSAYSMLLEGIRIARTPEEIEAAVDKFLEKHQLPDDLSVLYKCLQHSQEHVWRDAMGQIASLLSQGRVPSTMMLTDKLAELESRVTQEATKSYIIGLQSQIAAHKK